MQNLEHTADLPFKLWQRMEQQTAAEVSEQGRIDCVVVAAGIGSRMRSDRPKQYLMLGAHSILEWTVCQVLQAKCVRQVVLVLHPQDQFFAQTCLAQDPKLKARIKIVSGGKERADSVRSGLQSVQTEWCMVHDAARPFVNPVDIEYLADTVHKAHHQDPHVQGAILALPETDTVKLKFQDSVEDCPVIERTLDRSMLYRAQTPQMFKTNYLLENMQQLQQQGKVLTDEASVVDFIEADRALLVQGSTFNFKITTPADLVMAQAVLDFYQRS